MSQKTTAEDESVRPKSIRELLTQKDSEKLSQLAKKGKRSRQLEAMLRLHDHPKLFSRIPDDWKVDEEGTVQTKKLTVILTARASTKLSDVAVKAGCSRVQEATLRRHDHLRRVPEINGDYYEITTRDFLPLSSGRFMAMKCIDLRYDCFPERIGEMPDIDNAFVVRQVFALQNNFSGIDPQALVDDVPLSHCHVGSAGQYVSQSAAAQTGEAGIFSISHFLLNISSLITRTGG